MEPIKFLKKVGEALKNLDAVLEAYYLRPELETKVKHQSGTLADFNLKRASLRNHGESELLTSQSQIKALFERIKVVNTNFNLIRVGAKNDGGYLVPDDFEKVTTLFSPGVDKISEFELEFASRDIPCFMADASVSSTPISDNNFHFLKKFVHQGPDEGDFINFDSWVLKNTESYGDAALQMDIEGHEWEVIQGMSERTMGNFRFMVIEFHGMHQMAYQLPFQTIRSTFLKLIQKFEIVHVHANNAESNQSIHGFEVPPPRRNNLHSKGLSRPYVSKTRTVTPARFCKRTLAPRGVEWKSMEPFQWQSGLGLITYVESCSVAKATRAYSSGG